MVEGLAPLQGDARRGLTQIQRVMRAAELKPDERLILGISGGVDSMVLLFLMAHSPFADQIIAAHYNYGYRGTDSDLDEALVQNVCRTWGIACRSQRRHPGPELGGRQADARRMRYAFFESLAATPKGLRSRLVLAHHADDQAESFLLAAIRASDPIALGGMREISHGGRRLRPLLSTQKAELQAWAQTHNIPFREDGTNAQRKYLRNAIRLDVLPALDKAKSGASRKLSDWGPRLHDWGELVHRALADHPSWPAPDPKDGPAHLVLPQRGCNAADREVLRQWLVSWGLHASAAAEILKLNRPGTSWSGQGVQILRERDHWLWMKTPLPEGPAWSLREEIVESGGWSSPSRKDESVCFCDGTALKRPLGIRPWMPGDRMVPWGWETGTTAKISDLLTQAKVPACERASWPVVTDGKGEILWLPEIRRSQTAPVHSKSEHIVRLVCHRIDPKPPA